MRNRTSVIFLLTAITLAISLQTAASTLDKKATDVAINKYLATQKTAEEDAQSIESSIADLNSDGKPEIVLLWASMGPTYASTNLTVLTDAGKGYTPAATFGLNGQADAVTVKNGVILVDQQVLAKNDPLCCPSLKKVGKYRWSGNKLLELK